MKLSIIIPVYNVEDFLSVCLDSVVMQSVPMMSYEVIIINDSSPDQSLAVAEKYQAQYPQIKIISQENGGIAAARNTGMKAATGDYILLLDSDDFYSVDFFADLYQVIEEYSSPDLIMFDFNYFYSQDNLHEPVHQVFNAEHIESMTGKDVLAQILSKEPLFSWYPWRYAIKRKMIEANDLFFVKNRNYEDMMWTPLLYLHADQVVYLEIPAVEYRLQRPGQITGTISYKNLVDPIFAPTYLKGKMNSLHVSAELENKILRNTANKYFTAPFYAGYLTTNERMQLIHVLIDNKDLLNYTSSSLSKMVYVLIKCLGFKYAVNVIKWGMKVYQLIKLKKEGTPNEKNIIFCKRF